MVEMMESSITSNVIAALSFLVCLASLVVTFRTMTSAQKIQEEMEKMKINVIDRQRFLGYKMKAIKSLTMHKNSVEKAETISKKNCISLSGLLSEAKGFKNIFMEEDYNKIDETHQKLKKLSLLKDTYTDKHTQDYLELVIQFKNILEKGDYAL